MKKLTIILTLGLFIIFSYSCSQRISIPTINTPTITMTPTLSTPTNTRTITQTKTITPTSTITLTPDPGSHWTQATGAAAFVARGCHTSLVYNNQMWVIGGLLGTGTFVNDVWNSSDGITWNCATSAADFGPRGTHTSLVFNNQMWVIAGNGSCNDVWNSSNGVTWTQVTGTAEFEGRSGQSSVVFDNKMWVIGGTYFNGTYTEINDVWNSSDGVTWTQVTGTAEFSPRANHSSLVYNNKIWVIGGNRGFYNYCNDVWSSSDGIIWTQSTGAALFGARYGHTSVVYDNKMWVIGGAYFNGTYTTSINDIWNSNDGITWTQVTGTAAFSPRFLHSSVVYDNKMWVIGATAGPALNDVWWSE